jgi:hypothetical protein
LNQKSAQSIEEFQRQYKLRFSDTNVEKIDKVKQIETVITKLQNEQFEAKPIIDPSRSTQNIDDWLDDLILE